MTLDLSTAFGEPASARLRGLLPRRGRDSDDDEGPPSSAPGDGRPDGPTGASAHQAVDPPGVTADAARTTDEDLTAARAPRAGRSPRGTSTGRPSRPSAAAARQPPSGNRRWGMVRVTSREHADLLVLTALASGPNHARGVIELVHAASGGILAAPERTVHTTLHRLTRNRLLRRVPPGPRGGPRYALSDAGERAVAARVRQWRTFARAVDGVIARTVGD